MFAYVIILHMKKNDYILAIAILLFSILLNRGFVYLNFYSAGSADVAEVYVDDKLYMTIDLSVNDKYVITTPEGTNTIRVADHKLGIVEADCHGRDCIKMGRIASAGEYVCCLPHKLYVVIKSNNTGKTGENTGAPDDNATSYDTVAY